MASAPPAGTPAAAFAALAEQRFVSLTTFRRDGRRVPTPVWIAADGPDLVVATPSRSGKVERLRNDPTVELVPCSRTGRVAAGAAPVRTTATLERGSSTRTATGLLRRKYGLEHLVVRGLERLLAPRGTDRVLVRITAP